MDSQKQGCFRNSCKIPDNSYISSIPTITFEIWFEKIGDIENPKNDSGIFFKNHSSIFLSGMLLTRLQIYVKTPQFGHNL